jgi:hypothetical protein
MKHLLLLLFCLALTSMQSRQSTHTAKLVRDTVFVKDSTAFQRQSLATQQQLVALEKTVADTKESFYNSRLYLWSIIIGLVGCLIIVGGIFGFRGFNARMDEFRQNSREQQNDTQQALNRMQDRLTEQLQEVKHDFEEHWRDLTDRADRFEDKAEKQIEKGLTSDMKSTIQLIMHSTFGMDIKKIDERLITLEDKLGQLEGNTMAENTSSSETAEQKLGNIQGPQKTDNEFEDAK